MMFQEFVSFFLDWELRPPRASAQTRIDCTPCPPRPERSMCVCEWVKSWKKTCKKVANHNNCTLYNTVDSLSPRLNNLSTILSHVFDSDRFGFSVPQHMSAHSLLLVNLTIICHDGRIAWLLSISSMQEQMWILLAWASPLFLSAPAFKQLCGYTRDTSPWKCPGAFWHCDSIPVFFQSLRALRFANPSMEVCRELGSRVKPRVSLSYSASSASNASNLASRHLAPVSHRRCHYLFHYFPPHPREVLLPVWQLNDAQCAASK